MSSEIIDFASVALTESTSPPADRVVAGHPIQHFSNVLSSPDACFHSGRWASTIGTWRVRYSEYEFCHLLSGSVRLTTENGPSRVFRAGDSFLIPKGFIGIWEVIEACEKLYVIYEPGAAATR